MIAKNIRKGLWFVGCLMLVSVFWGAVIGREGLIICLSIALVFFLSAGVIGKYYVPANRQEEPGAWQKEVKRLFRIEIKNDRVILYEDGKETGSFEWSSLNKLTLQKRMLAGKSLPVFVLHSVTSSLAIPLAASGEKKLEEKIHALPNYFDTNSKMEVENIFLLKFHSVLWEESNTELS